VTTPSKASQRMVPADQPEPEQGPVERAAEALCLNRSTPDGMAHDVLEAGIGETALSDAGRKVLATLGGAQ
jgi:hypothetical protein